ncbi:MAG: SIS domain-containing protein [Clostridia bacterium]|nr:SIS domain-containing protein [Clostridia bacterium]
MESIDLLIGRYPKLIGCRADLLSALDLLCDGFRCGGTLFTCGNGGSAADADHIVGELAKGFLEKRPVPAELREALAVYPDGDAIADGLQGGLPAVSLHSQSALLTAFANDCEPSLVYAQALYALAKPGDLLLAISTSGNSRNVVNAAKLAKVRGVTVIALTGEKPSQLSALADCAIRVGDTETYRVQELHLPAYHWLCAGVEAAFFAEKTGGTT